MEPGFTASERPGSGDPGRSSWSRVDHRLHPGMDIRISTPRPMPSRPPVRSVQDMSTATKGYPSGSMRVSDADRDRAIAELSEHYQAGRLTTEEFEDRSGRALQALTTADLADLFTDLPRRQAPTTGAAATSTAPANPAKSWPARVPVAPV